jgi:SAM-dependent methyltransferase
MKITPQLYDSVYSRRVNEDYVSVLDSPEGANKFVEQLRFTGFVSRRDPRRDKTLLRRYVSRLPASEVKGTLLEIGCGFGRFGCWLAAELDLDLVGLDFSPVAIKYARLFAGRQTDQCTGSFHVADFNATGLRAGSITCAISVDALYLASNPTRALREIRRVLMPGGPLLFTVYQENGTCLQTWLDALERANFNVIHRLDKSTEWRRLMRLKHERRCIRRHEITSRLGIEGKRELEVSAAMLGLHGKRSFLDTTSRFEILAAARPHTV